MIDDLKPYPEYKDSGLPWLGAIPGHWPTRRTKTVISNVVEQTTTMSRDDVYLALEHVESWTGRVRPVVGDLLFTGQVKRFRAGDVLFGKLRPYLAKVADATVQGVCAGEFFVLRPRDSNIISRYLEHLLRSKPAIDVINGSTFGAKMPRADWQFLGNLPIPIPPPAEQAAIVRFLDHANGKIERAIRAKKKLIALLNEQKQAIIHRAVTRGLDPNVKLKPSGIPWLGDVPEHWEVRRAKYIFNEVDERSPTGDEELLSVSHITGVTPRSEKTITMFKAASYVGHKICRPGDLVINTMWAWMAALGSSSRLGIVSSSYGVYRPRQLRVIFGRYVDSLLHTPAYMADILCRSTGIRASRLRLYPEQFLKMQILLPPYAEQEAMFAWADNETKALRAAITRTEREIALLREYRTTLTADVVTGKLDVREAAKHLPAEAGEPLPADDLADAAPEEADA